MSNDVHLKFLTGGVKAKKNKDRDRPLNRDTFNHLQIANNIASYSGQFQRIAPPAPPTKNEESASSQFGLTVLQHLDNIPPTRDSRVYDRIATSREDNLIKSSNQHNRICHYSQNQRSVPSRKSSQNDKRLPSRQSSQDDIFEPARQSGRDDRLIPSRRSSQNDRLTPDAKERLQCGTIGQINDINVTCTNIQNRDNLLKCPPYGENEQNRQYRSNDRLRLTQVRQYGKLYKTIIFRDVK